MLYNMKTVIEIATMFVATGHHLHAVIFNYPHAENRFPYLPV
jgi:hypothetical protein